MTTPHTFPVEPTSIHVSDGVLDGLRARLALTRPPVDEGNGDWFYAPASTPPRSASAHSRPARRPSGSTTSTSTPTTTAATSSPGRTPTLGSTTCAAPSRAAGPEQLCRPHEMEPCAEPWRRR